jgi:hydroxymethylpyrimidine/phosphomethylpyrimidine kinase
MRNQRGNVSAHEMKPRTESGVHSTASDVQSGASGRVLVVVVGGLDPTGGAGVVRDLLTARTLNARVRLVPTAWTAQSAASGVTAIEPRDPDAVEAALREAIDAGRDPSVRFAVKIGMLANLAVAGAVARGLEDFRGPVVFDPVLGASSGGSLFAGDPADLLPLATGATVFTPNAGEAAVLTGRAVVDLKDAEEAGQALIRGGAAAVLVKGGHLTGDLAVDLLVTPGQSRRFEATRLSGPPVRGTGCALATAIAVALGRGLPLEAAIADAKGWLHTAIASAVAVGGERHLS